jgi:hypothetical protein
MTLYIYDISRTKRVRRQGSMTAQLRTRLLRHGVCPDGHTTDSDQWCFQEDNQDAAVKK